MMGVTKKINKVHQQVSQTLRTGTGTQDAVLSQSAVNRATLAPISLTAISLQDFNTTDCISLIVTKLTQWPATRKSANISMQTWTSSAGIGVRMESRTCC